MHHCRHPISERIGAVLASSDDSGLFCPSMHSGKEKCTEQQFISGSSITKTFKTHFTETISLIILNKRREIQLCSSFHLKSNYLTWVFMFPGAILLGQCSHWEISTAFFIILSIGFARKFRCRKAHGEMSLVPYLSELMNRLINSFIHSFICLFNCFSFLLCISLLK